MVSDLLDYRMIEAVNTYIATNHWDLEDGSKSQHLGNLHPATVKSRVSIKIKVISRRRTRHSLMSPSGDIIP